MPNKLLKRTQTAGCARASLLQPAIFSRLAKRYMPMRYLRVLCTIFIIAITFTSEAGYWYPIKGSSNKLKFHKPTFEDKMWTYISNNSTDVFQSVERYTYKYDVKDNIILIHAYCEISEKEIESQYMFLPLDGGSCYFEVQYDYKLKKFLLIAVNGEAQAYNKLINKDKKQLAVFVPQHFSQQFFAHYQGVICSQ